MRVKSPGRSVTFLVLATSIALGACAVHTDDPSSADDSESISGSCAIAVTQNVYDGAAYWGTITFKNTGASTLNGFAVSFDVPSGAHCTNDAVPAGAVLSPLTGSGSSAHTTKNHCTFTWASEALAAGASKTFNYSTDSTSFGAATHVVANSATCASPAPDAGTDSGHDAGADSGTDSGSDAGSDTGADAGSDAGGITAGNFPARFAAPYVETWNDNDLAALANATGHKFYTLAFVINGLGTCNPTWNGDTSLTGNKYGSYITGLRNVGGDVIVSFGGASGTELGQACGTVASLQAAYQKVISQFHLTWIDLDIESGAE